MYDYERNTFININSLFNDPLEFDFDLEEMFKKDCFTKAVKQKILLTVEEVTVLLTRKIAIIKRDYTAQHDDLIKRYAKYYKIDDLIGYTYLEQIVEYLNKVIKNVEKKYPSLIVKFEGKTPRRKV